MSYRDIRAVSGLITQGSQAGAAAARRVQNPYKTSPELAAALGASSTPAAFSIATVGRVSRSVDLVVDVGISTPHTPSRQRYVVMISRPSICRVAPSSAYARRNFRLTRAALTSCAPPKRPPAADETRTSSLNPKPASERSLDRSTTASSVGSPWICAR